MYINRFLVDMELYTMDCFRSRIDEINSLQHLNSKTTAQASPCTTPIILQNVNNPSKILLWFSSKNASVKMFVVREICLSSAILEYVISKCYLV